MKLALLHLSTQEGILSTRDKCRHLTLGLGASAVEATRFATGVSQICRDTLRQHAGVNVEFSFQFERNRNGLWLRFCAPTIPSSGLAHALFDSVDVHDGDIFVHPRISRELPPPSPEWVTRAKELLEEKSRVELMAELREQNLTLARHRDELEATVAERTQDLRAATIVAEQASAAKTDFLSHMSHELRTPLNGVLGYAQILLRDQSATARQKKSLEAIESCGRHLLALINDVLDLAKIEAGRLELVESAIDLHAVLDGACHITEPRASAKGVLVEQQRAGDVPQSIIADETKLKQAIVNLMGNSAKFTERGRVVLRVSLITPRRLKIEVEDTGIGMSPEDLATVFEPFKQAEGGKVRGGTGLGLAITRRVIGAMGGTIDVASELGKGTTFRVELPIRVAEAARAERAGSARWSRAGAKLVLADGRAPHALVVDDNPTNRDVAEAVLVDAGIVVTHATDGHGALAAMRAERFDVVLMDILMPGMGGEEAVRLIRQDPELSSTKVIAMTASVESDLVQRLSTVGFDRAIQKPFEVRALLELLAEELGANVAVGPDSSDAPPPVVEDSALLLAPGDEAVSRITHEIEEAISLGDLDGLVEAGERLAQDAGPLAPWGRRIAELAGAFDFDGLERLSEQLRSGRVT